MFPKHAFLLAQIGARVSVRGSLAWAFRQRQRGCIRSPSKLDLLHRTCLKVARTGPSAMPASRSLSREKRKLNRRIKQAVKVVSDIQVWLVTYGIVSPTTPRTGPFCSALTYLQEPDGLGMFRCSVLRAIARPSLFEHLAVVAPDRGAALDAELSGANLERPQQPGEFAL